MKYYKLSKEEQKILKELEKSEFKSVKNVKREV